jgi:hypothetical protein
MRVAQRFDGGEGFRADNEQGLLRVQIAHGLDEIGAVRVGHKAQPVARRLYAQGFESHDRAQIRATDNVDHIAMAC